VGLWLVLVGIANYQNEDPRNVTHVRELEHRRESDSFKERLRRGVREDFPWPGLRAAQVSWTWLELLSGIHQEESYTGDFSWVFSKLFTVTHYANDKEIYFLSSLAPFYFVIGKDQAGATLFLSELLKRDPSSFHVLFWGGFHALDNLFMKNMAAYFYEKAALSPKAPTYLPALSFRLRFGEDVLGDPRLRKQILESQVSPQMRKQLENVRPNWFEK